MQPKYKEAWIVKVGKELFTIDEEEIKILKNAMKSNERWVSFPKFIISIPHIECIYLESKEIAYQLEAPATESVKTLSPEELRIRKEELVERYQFLHKKKSNG